MLTTAHIQRIQDWHGGFLADLDTAWVKIVNPPVGKRLFPHVRGFCARFWTDDIDGAFVRRGREGGRDFVQLMLPRWLATPATCYELANEPDSNSNDGLANLREYTLGAIEEAERHGLKLCILNLPEGNPHDNGTHDEDVSAWKLEQLRPAVVAAARGGHYVGLHAYWRPGVEGPRGRWHALGRVQWTLRQWGISSLKVLVNETGIDGGIAGHPGQQGWQRLETESEYRAQIVDAERYARQSLAQLGVEALMYFTFGYEPPWQEFEHPEGFCRDIVAPLKALASPTQPQPILTHPLPWSRVSQTFGGNAAYYQQFGLAGHNGWDLATPEGVSVYDWHCAPVVAAHAGQAIVASSNGYGLYVYIMGAQLDTVYGHLAQALVRQNEMVRPGQVIGRVGYTGTTLPEGVLGTHLHFGVRPKPYQLTNGYRGYVDPGRYL